MSVDNLIPIPNEAQLSSFELNLFQKLKLSRSNISFVERYNKELATDKSQAIILEYIRQLDTEKRYIPDFPKDDVVSLLAFRAEQKGDCYTSYFDIEKRERVNLGINVEVTDLLYVIRTKNGGIYLFIDHQDCIKPTASLYESLKASVPEKYISKVLVTLMTDLGIASKEDKVKSYIDRHVKVAEQNGVRLDENDIFDVYSASRGARMHCYSFPLHQEDDIGLYENRSIDTLFHSMENQDNQSITFRDMIGRIDDESMLNIFQVDVFPFAEMSRLQVLSEVGREFLERYVSRRNNDYCEENYPERNKVSDAVLAEYIYHFCTEIGTRSYDDHNLISVKFEGNRTMIDLYKGIIEWVRFLDLDSIDCLMDILREEGFISQDIEVIFREGFELEGLLMSAEMNEKRIPLYQDAQNFLQFKTIQDFMLRFEPHWQKILEYGIGSLSNQYLVEREKPVILFPMSVVDYPLMPILPMTRSIEGNTDFIPSSNLFAYFLDEDLSIDLGSSDNMITNFASSINDHLAALIEYLGNANIQRQLNESNVESIMQLLHWLKEEVAVVSQDKDDLYHVKRKIRDIFNSARNVFNNYCKKNPDLRQNLILLYKRLSFFEMTITAYSQIDNYGFNISNPKFFAEGFVMKGEENYPPHLVFDWMNKTTRLIDKLRYSIVPHVDNSHHEHIGMRANFIYRHKNRDVALACLDFLYINGKAVKREWAVSDKTIQILSEIIKKMDSEQKALIDNYDSISYEEKSELDNSIGELIIAEAQLKYVQYYQVVLENLVYPEKLIPILQEWLEFSTAIAEGYHLNNRSLNLSSGVGLFDSFLHINNIVENLLMNYSDKRIRAIEDIGIEAKRPTVFFGANESGKSSMLRAFGLNAHFANSGIPVIGDVHLQRMSVLTMEGAKFQKINSSLFTQMIPLINDFLEKENDHSPILLLLDELGKTNKTYGEAFIISILLACYFMKDSNNKNKNLLAGATHYHDIANYKHFFEQFGLDIQFLMVENYKHRPLEEGEKIKSHAYRTLSKVFPLKYLQLWPDHKDFGLEAKNDVEKYTPTVASSEIIKKTKEDLYGDEKERQYAYSLRYGMSDIESSSFDNYWLNEENIENKKDFVEYYAYEIDDLNDMIAVYEKVGQLAQLSTRKHSGGFFDYLRFSQAQARILGIDQESLVVEEFLQKISNSLDSLIDRFNFINQKLKRMFEKFKQLGTFIDDIKTVKDFAYNSVEKSFISRIGKISSLLKYARYYATDIAQNKNEFCRVEYNDLGLLEGRNVKNPLIDSVENNVGNDVLVDFSDGKAGNVITGENHSGKSNHLRTMGIMMLEALCLGYVRADHCSIDPRIIPISLTQPVSDVVGSSTMRKEADRLINVLNALGIKDRLSVVLLDEPGAPTSPEDAEKIIVWLYRLILSYANESVKLIITTHQDDLKNHLQENVDYSAFMYLSENPFKMIPGSADSNAIAVARAHGLNPKFADLVEMVRQMILDVMRIDEETFDDQENIDSRKINIMEACAATVQKLYC